MTADIKIGFDQNIETIWQFIKQNKLREIPANIILYSISKLKLVPRFQKMFFVSCLKRSFGWSALLEALQEFCFQFVSVKTLTALSTTY